MNAPPQPDHPTDDAHDAGTEPTPARSRWLPLLAAGLVAVLLPVVTMFGLLDHFRDMADGLRAQGVWSVPLYTLLVALLIGLAILPSHAMNLLTGYIYGMVIGLPAALAAVALGAGVGHRVGRSISVDHLRSLVRRRSIGRALIAAMVDTSPGQATLAVTLARLAPQLPYALGNIVAAALGVKLLPFMLGTMVGMLPRAVAGVWVGTQLQSWSASATSPHAVALAIAAAVIGLTGLGWWAHRVIQRLERRSTDQPQPVPVPVIDE